MGRLSAVGQALAVLLTMSLGARAATPAMPPPTAPLEGGPPIRQLFDGQSQYNRVIVTEDPQGLRSMQFGEEGTAQSTVDVHDPNRLVDSYTQTCMVGLALAPHPRHILMVGLGGGAMPIYLRHNFPEAAIEVAELDPLVAELARRFFYFSEDPMMHVHLGDGRRFVRESDNLYDLVFLDAYGADDIPYLLATREFLQEVRARLTRDALVVANVWGSGSNKLYFSMISTYQDVFPELHIVRSPIGDNHIFLAQPHHTGVTADSLATRAAAVEPRLNPKLPLAKMVRNGYESLPKVRAHVLLDEEEPVDGK